VSTLTVHLQLSLTPIFLSLGLPATDVITASQYLENAIHDPTVEDTYNDLANVVTQLEHAHAYLLTAYTSYGNPTYNR